MFKTLKAVLLFYALLIVGCTSKYVLNSTDVEKLKKLQFQDIQDKAKYSLDYIIGNQKYRFSTFKVESSSRFIQVLQSESEVLAVSFWDKGQYAHLPNLAKCTLFPSKPDINVEMCFKEFNDSVLQKDDKDWKRKILIVDTARKELEESSYQEGVGAFFGMFVTAVILEPYFLLIPVVWVPIQFWDERNSRNQFNIIPITLGENPNLTQVLDSLDSTEKSIVESNGTAYFGAGMITKSPQVAFGFNNNKVLWIWRRPSCGGLIKGTCKFGIHSVKSKDKKQITVRSSSDNQQNIIEGSPQPVEVPFDLNITHEQNLTKNKDLMDSIVKLKTMVLNELITTAKVNPHSKSTVNITVEKFSYVSSFGRSMLASLAGVAEFKINVTELSQENNVREVTFEARSKFSEGGKGATTEMQLKEMAKKVVQFINAGDKKHDNGVMKGSDSLI